MDNYIEPFAGSLAVLLGRPAWHTKLVETVNDKDAYLANFWRALRAAPEAVAQHADWPVNETDLMARHLWLVNEVADRIARLEADPDYFDAQVAGWWVWGICSWIGSGWCSPNGGPWIKGPDGRMCRRGQDDAGRGVNRQLPHLGDAGRGVNRKLPNDLLDYFEALAARLRKIRVCCGDWSRIVTDGAIDCGASVGVFLDPPYLGEVRTEDLYANDDHTISHAVRQWAIEHGDDPRLRIVLAGYEAEHAEHMPATWRVHAYSAHKGYGTSASAKSGRGNSANRHGERLWFSPHCLSPDSSGCLFTED